MKKIIGLLVVFAIIAGMIPSMALASTEVVFYNADNGEVITKLDGVENVYAEMKIDAKENTASTVYVAHYKKSGMLGGMEAIDKVVATETGIIDYTTPVFSVAQSKLVKVFAWEEETLEPVFEMPGVAVREKEVIPTATVKELDVAEITDVPLTFAMNFKADKVIEEQLEAYGDWYADYELTVNKDVTYNAEGTEDAYLAGQYDAWSKDWVVVPKGSYLVEANTPVKIMETAEELYGKKGLKYTYREIYERVKDFDCGIFFNEEFMAANPYLVVTLELKMYNPENENEFYTIGEVYKFGTEAPEPAEKFDLVFKNTDKYMYRVGNSGNVSIDKLFVAKDGVQTGNISVEIESVDNSEATGTYSESAREIDFEGTGVVKVTIKDDDEFCKPTELYLEVADAKNVTSATNVTSENIVLLNDVGFSSLEVSGGYTLFGNGFTMTCGSDSPALDFGYAFVTMNNGILDNVQIDCPDFDYAALYKSNLTSSENRSQTTDRTRYYNAKSGVMVYGNSKILNSRVSGGRASVNVAGGDVLIDNSQIELGAVASVLVGAANSLTLKDVTLIQKPTASTYDPAKTLMGFSVLYLCDANGNATATTIEGSLVQQAWIDEDDTKYVPSDGKKLVSEILKETEYLHDIDGDGTNESLNLGFAYMPEDISADVAQPANITDNRTDKDSVVYATKGINVSLSGLLSTTVYVFSYKNINGTADSFKSEINYVPNKNSDIVAVAYNDATDGLEQSKSLSKNGWVYELNVDLDKLGGYAFDFSKLSVYVNGKKVSDYKVNGNVAPSSPIAVVSGGTEYVITATVDGKEHIAYFKVTGTETSKDSPMWSADATGSTLSTSMNASWAAGLCVASSYGGTWHGAAPALENVYVRYWSVAEQQYKTIHLADCAKDLKGQLNGTNTTWTYTPSNGDFTLTLTGGQVHSSNNVYAMPVVVDSILYFVPAKSSGLVNSGNSARTIPVTYSFKDNNGGEELKGSHTWSVAENKDAEYSYSDFCSGTKTKLEKSTSCLAAGTLITLADGTKRAVEDLRKGDKVMTFDHVNGNMTSDEVIIVVKTRSDLYYKNTFVFDDDTRLVTINEHGIYDLDLKKYVNIDHENYNEFIGHNFVSVDNEGNIGTKKLVDVICEENSGYKYDIVTDGTLNYVAEDTLSVTHVLVDVINSFDFADDMTYDKEKMYSDIETYGLYSYDEWKEYCDITVFEQYNIPVMEVGISKGLYTQEYIVDLINTYVLDESVQIIAK